MALALTEARAQVFFSGNDVHAWCQSDRSKALVYTAGLSDESVHGSIVLESLQPFDEAERKAQAPAFDITMKVFGAFCRPNEATLDQATDIFCAYLRASPQDLHEGAYLLFHKAMKKAWPCP